MFSKFITSKIPLFTVWLLLSSSGAKGITAEVVYPEGSGGGVTWDISGRLPASSGLSHTNQRLTWEEPCSFDTWGFYPTKDCDQGRFGLLRPMADTYLVIDGIKMSQVTIQQSAALLGKLKKQGHLSGDFIFKVKKGHQIRYQKIPFEFYYRESSFENYVDGRDGRYNRVRKEKLLLYSSIVLSAGTAIVLLLFFWPLLKRVVIRSVVFLSSSWRALLKRVATERHNYLYRRIEEEETIRQAVRQKLSDSEKP